MSLGEDVRYVKIQKIGEGAYGVIYKAQEISTKKMVALKKFKLNENEGIPSCALREISILKQLNHPNIIRLISQIIFNKKLHLVMDYYQMDLVEYLKINHTQGQLKNVMYKLSQAVEYLHSRKIMHRDIQPSNILLSENEPILIDFGFAKTNSIMQTQGVTQLWYRAPEILQNIPYNQAIDVWSLGCVFLEIVIRKPIFIGSSETHQYLIIKGMINGDNWMAQQFGNLNLLFIDLIQVIIKYIFKNLLQIEPQRRINMSQVLQHVKNQIYVALFQGQQCINLQRIMISMIIFIYLQNSDYSILEFNNINIVMTIWLLDVMFLQALLYSVTSLSIFPNYFDSQAIQWEENIWMDCSTQKEITPYNCNNDETNWQECYLVPENGMCLKQNMALSQPGSTNFNFTFASSSMGQTVEIDINEQVTSQNISSSVWISQEVSGNTISIKIKTNGLILNSVAVSTDCAYRCSECNDDHTCKACQSDSFLFNYLCIPNSCTDQTSLLAINSHLSTVSEIDQNTTNFKLQSKFNLQIQECLVPKIYLTKSLLDGTILSVLGEDQITINSNDTTTIYYYLTPEQFQSCQLIETTDSFIYQCFIGITFTMNQLPQYSLLLIGQITVSRSTNVTTDTIQAFGLPQSSGTQQVIGPIIVVSDATDTVIDTNNQLVQTSQETIDPTYSNYTATFSDGQIVQNDTAIPLTLVDQSQDGSTTNYVLSYDNTDFNVNTSYSIEINSTLTSTSGSGRRILSQRNVIPKLKTKNIVSSNIVTKGTIIISSSSVTKASLSGGVLAGIFIAVFIVSFILILGSLILNGKIQEKYHNIGNENNQNEIIVHTEPEQQQQQQN